MNEWMNGTNVVKVRGWITWSTSCGFTAYLLSFLLSCGDHFNPDGMSHGGPQDSERVSVGLGLAENPRSQRHGRQLLEPESVIPFGGSLSPSFYFVRFKNIYRHFLCSRPDPVSQPGEGDTQNSMVAAQPEHLCRSLREALGTQSKLQIQSEGHRQWERASQRR